MKHIRYTYDTELMMEMVDCLVDGDWSNQAAVERAWKLINEFKNNVGNDPTLPVDVALARLQVQFNAGIAH